MSPRRLRVMNTSNRTCIANLSFASSVLAVRLNLHRLVVVLERKTLVHHLNTLEVMRVIDTPPNPKGIGALSPSSEQCYYALPNSADAGMILVFDCLQLQARCELRAHRAPLECLAFNSDGTLLASASEKGTIIRVHLLPQATKAFTFRRGSYPTTIHSLCFSPPNIHPPLLSASSSKGTVHVFKLEEQQRSSGVAGLGGGLLASVIPFQIDDVVDSARCFATIRLPVTGVPTMCAIVPSRQSSEATNNDMSASASSSSSTDSVRVLAVTATGYFYEYTMRGLDSPGGPECNLETESILHHSSSEGGPSAARWLDGDMSEKPLGASFMDEPLSTSILLSP
eukprot:CAMPEP_0197861876 /NCGR_PEP_ID=MMETSP1438-20131217/38172_1 /TAXON_ID=1461541 /ORGANISM="Pterosperma sp., Strain CCMP1384" /LENGTH=339 /DNA_ID=CAMNT_0043479199 /DNA_START=432 /DNA_END=1451 /DNA_ORIENTATION=+